MTQTQESGTPTLVGTRQVYCSNKKHAAEGYIWKYRRHSTERRETIIIDVFWDVIPCNLVGAHHRFGGTCCFFLQGIRYNLKMEAIDLLETLIAIHQSTCHIQKTVIVIFIDRVNLKSHTKYCSGTNIIFLTTSSLVVCVAYCNM